MKRRKLQLNALRAFEAAARNLSVTGAARELAVTHSAVSHQLRQLEDELGVRLFERNNRGLRMTAQGEMLAPVLRESLDRISETLDRLQANDDHASIRITCTPTFAAKWLVPRLGDWYARGESRRINLHPTLDLLDLHDQDYDLAIRCGTPPWDKLCHEPVMPIHLVPVCSPEYAANHRLLTQPGDALQHDLIHADVGDHGQGTEWRDWLSGNGADCPRSLPGLSFHDPALAMQAAADGLGLAIGYLELIDRDLQNGHLITASDLTVRHPFSYYLVYPDSARENPAITEFRRWILQQV